MRSQVQRLIQELLGVSGKGEVGAQIRRTPERAAIPRKALNAGIAPVHHPEVTFGANGHSSVGFVISCMPVPDAPI